MQINYIQDYTCLVKLYKYYLQNKEYRMQQVKYKLTIEKNWITPSLSELTPIIFNTGLTHLGSVRKTIL